MGVAEILNEWIAFRSECVSRRVYFDLNKAKEKLHLLLGLKKILLDIDKAIKIVRETEEESEVVPNLMIGFGIDEIQAEYVAEIKLRHLNREYILKRTADIENLIAEIEEMESVLKSRTKLLKIIIKELEKVADQIKEIHDAGVEVGIVVGGGNFFRGRTGGNIDKPTADYMGMLATCMNGLAVQDALLSAGCPAKLMTAIEIRDMAEGYARRKALDYLEEGKVVVFGGGTGSPFFTTDTTAALRAAEIGADVLLLAKNIDAVYSDDPRTNPDAERYTELTYMDIVDKDLKVMDLTAATLCKDTGTKIYVFALATEGNLMKVINGENVGTLIQ
jgi:uridylate kinase